MSVYIWRDGHIIRLLCARIEVHQVDPSTANYSKKVLCTCWSSILDPILDREPSDLFLELKKAFKHHYVEPIKYSKTRYFPSTSPKDGSW